MFLGSLHPLVSARFRLCAIALLLGACLPIEQAEDGAAADAGTTPNDAALVREDAASFSQLVVQVAGYLGQGLKLALDGSQEAEVPGDGMWQLSLAQPASRVDLTVLKQPSVPDQLCSVTKLEANVFSIVCREQSWDVSGTVAGYAGKGLQLGLFDGGATPVSVVEVAADGGFAFADKLPDGVDYEVRVVTQPSGPRQECTVAHASGHSDGADITDLQVSCTTKTYLFTSVVTGLQGTGLALKTSAGTFAIDAPGSATYANAPLQDGVPYHVEIASQPTNPNQICYVEGGTGVVDGANVSFHVTCAAQGTLRISEIGACPYSNSACWLELVNMGPSPENLAFYTLRTSAISPLAFTPARTFALPSIAVPPHGTVVLQAKTAGAMADGQGIYHIGDGDVVPWWSVDGFVELLTQTGATADFVRFGANAVEPMTGGVWAGGASPALPRGTGAYGRSLQGPSSASGVLRHAEDFALRAFATYAGDNDVVNDIDADDDGIPDSAEIPGGTFGGLNLYAMGARTGQRDVFVEIDHMAGADAATLPRKDALDKVVAAFARQHIALHFDVGSLFSASFDPGNYNLGGGNEVPFSPSVGLSPTDSAITDLYDLKAAQMAGARRMVFYYQLFAWSQQKDGSGGSSGVGEMPGNDSIITLGGFGLTTNNAVQRNLVTNYQAASIMHELGHNFGLRHGGSDSINRKPNYVSVMNYLYSPLGLPTIGYAEGDRYDFYKRCTLISVTQLTNAPSGATGNFILDYSGGSSASLDESALLERAGLGRASSSPVDYDCDRQIDGAAYSRDLNADGALDLLEDSNDWGMLDFVFRRYPSGAENGPSLLTADSTYHHDMLTSDQKFHTDEPCPPPMAPSELE
jgi:hypothetical protein